jgi:hypothetical protein
MTDAEVTTRADTVMNAAPKLRPAVAWAAIVVLVVLAVVRSAVATRTDGFTIDDAYHITAGVSYVRLRDFRLNPEHPPLVKLWVGAALARDFQLPPLRPLEVLKKQIERLSSNEPLERIPPVRGMRAE